MSAIQIRVERESQYDSDVWWYRGYCPVDGCGVTHMVRASRDDRARDLLIEALTQHVADEHPTEQPTPPNAPAALQESQFFRSCPVDPEHRVSGFFLDDQAAADALSILIDEHVRAEHASKVADGTHP